MKNLRKHEIRNHLFSSVSEVFPFDHEVRPPGPAGGNTATNGYFSSRNHTSPANHLRDDRSFTQSLWGRR